MDSGTLDFIVGHLNYWLFRLCHFIFDSAQECIYAIYYGMSLWVYSVQRSNALVRVCL